jgi:hypothetical protein
MRCAVLVYKPTLATMCARHPARFLFCLGPLFVSLPLACVSPRPGSPQTVDSAAPRVPEPAEVDAGDDLAALPDLAEVAVLPDGSAGPLGADGPVDSSAACINGRSVTGDQPCPPPNKMFVTSMAFTADLGGLAGADAKCAASARAANLMGTFVALLSTRTASAFSRLADTSGWVRVDGRPVGNAPADLRHRVRYYPPVLDEMGTRVPDLVSVFTGTNSDGSPSVEALGNDWGPPTPGQRCKAGNPLAGSSLWFSTYEVDCSSMARLYCFEVGRQSEVAPERLPPQVRLAFLSNVVSPSIGLAGADAACLQEARAAGLSGGWKALLASATGPAAARFAAGPRWYRTDGVELATTLQELGADRTQAPLRVDARGAPLDAQTTWTGAASASAASTENCRNWGAVDPAVMGRMGRADFAGRGWFNAGAIGCHDNLGRLYCLQE